MDCYLFVHDLDLVSRFNKSLLLAILHLLDEVS